MASISRRFTALFVDWIPCVLIGSLVAGSYTHQSWQAPAILILEYGLFVGLFAQTLGMRLLRIRCVRVDTGGPIGIPRALLRGLLLSLLIPAVVINSEGRGLHDRAVGSIVLENPPRA